MGGSIGSWTAWFLTCSTRRRRRSETQSIARERCMFQGPHQNGCGRRIGFIMKRTSKAASGTRKTSSQSGTSDQTVATGKKPRRRRNKSAGVARVEGMKAAQSRESLIQAGIATPAGELSDKYQPPKKPAK